MKLANKLKDVKQKHIKMIKDIRQKRIEQKQPAVYQMLVVIVKRGEGSKVLEVLANNKIEHSVVGFGNGIASGLLATLTGMYSKEKEIIYTLIPQKSVDNILEYLDKDILSKEKYTGIAFTIPLKSIVESSLKSI